MKRVAALFFSALMIMGLSGCIHMDMLVKVKKDGSGTLVQKVLMGKEIVKDLVESGDFCDKEDFIKSATTMGKGVEFVSVKNLENEKFMGCEAIYSFKDVNNLSVDQNPGGNMPVDSSEKDQTHEYVTFAFKKDGKKSILTINMPEKKSSDAKADKVESKQDEEELTPEEVSQKAMMDEMMKQMFTDMFIGLSVEVDGKVVKSDASFLDGSNITLMKLDFNKLLADEAKFNAFTKADAKTMEETKGLMMDVPGINAERKQNITVVFK